VQDYAEQQGAGTDGVKAVEALREGIATSGAGFVKAFFGGHDSKLRFRARLHHRPIGGWRFPPPDRDNGPVERYESPIAIRAARWGPFVLLAVSVIIGWALTGPLIEPGGMLVSLCPAVLILLGMGITELSMSAPSIPRVKEMIRSVTSAQAKELLDDIMKMEHGVEIRTYLHKVLKASDASAEI